MPKKLQQFFISLREHTCLSYAKIANATNGGPCDINLMIIKATSPDDFPLSDQCVHVFLKILNHSSSSCQVFVLQFAHRLGTTKAWRVALKCLLLLHRLLRGLPDHSAFRAELLWARTNGEMLLHPCKFQDSSSSSSEIYSAFIRSYARLLDEALHCIPSTTGEEQSPASNKDGHNRVMRELRRIIEVLPQLQRLIDCTIDCQPTGAAARSFLVRMAMKHILRHSFVCYDTYRREVVVVLENLIQLPYKSFCDAFSIYKKAACQADRLSEFLEWSKSMGYCGSYEYPNVDRIPEIQIRALEALLDGMWRLSDESSTLSASSETSIQWEAATGSPSWESSVRSAADSGMDDSSDCQCGDDLDEPFDEQQMEVTGFGCPLVSNPFLSPAA